MATDYEELSDDEIEARQRAEDGEDPNHDPTTGEGDGDGGSGDAGADGEGDQSQDGADGAEGAGADGDPNAQAGADGGQQQPEGAAEKTAGAEGEAKGKVEGVASKDGSRVLPYGVLQAARRDARRAETRAERLERELNEAKQQLEDLKAGKPPADGEELTEEKVKQLEENFPEQGKAIRKLYEKAQAAAPAKTDTEEDHSDDPVQEVIDQVPLLVEWQNDPAHAEQWQRAVEHDALLMKSPKWKDRTPLERFTEATRRTAEEFDIEFPEPKATTSTTAAPAKKAGADPKTAATNAARKPPETLSDFKGGSVADHGSIDVKRMAAPALLDRMKDMSDDEIDAHLAKYG